MWLAGESPRREAFTITPAGYYFRKRTFRKLDALINEFKRHPQPPPSAAEEDFTQQLAAVGFCTCIWSCQPQNWTLTQDLAKVRRWQTQIEPALSA